MATKPPIIVGLYPDVPFARGVPQLRRSPTVAQIQILAIATAAITGRLWHAVQSAPKWGIYPAGFKPANNGATLRDLILGNLNPFSRFDDEPANGRVIVPDSVLDFGYRNEYRVSDFPVQQGGFASYNKVATPFECVVRLSKSSDLAGRAAFLIQIDDAARSLDLYDILTPERTYANVNITRYEVTRRGSGGAYFLTDVDVYFREIRQVAAQFSTTTAATRNAQEPSAVPDVNQGVRQPAELPGSVVWP